MPVVLGTYKHGQILYFPNDVYMGVMLRDFGEYSDGEVDLFRQIVRPGDIVVEVGANLGVHTIPLAKMAGPTGKVLAFEPQLRIYHLLCGNLGINNLDNVIALNTALGDSCGTSYVPLLDYDSPGNFGGVPIDQPQLDRSQTRAVARATLDSIGDQLSSLRLLKADVEGMEAEVLVGAERLIRRTKPFLYVENDRRSKSSHLLKVMFDLNYRVFWHIPPYVSKEHDSEFSGMGSMNLFGVPIGMDVHIEMQEITDPDDDFLDQVEQDDISKRI
jgi:FkbM family methyltransferase